MTHLRTIGRAGPHGPQLADLPGLRVLRSAHFRTILAGVLLVVGVAVVSLMLLRQADAPDGQFGIDLRDYLAASTRLAEGASPYAADMLAGPVDAQGLDRYRYPPILAQLVSPLAAQPDGVTEVLWLVGQAAAVLAALWVGSGLRGARRTLERALWCGVAAVYFMPVFDTLWKGNVSGLLALACVAVALGGPASGFAAAAATLLKSVPATLLPVALVSDRGSRRTALLVLALAAGLSILLAPGAWLDYPVVLLDMARGSTAYAANLAPAAVLGDLSGSGLLGGIARLGALIAAGAALLASVLLARRHAGLPAAALLATLAMLLLPGSLWYHYLVVLLPFAAMAWSPAAPAARLLLLISAALISLGLAWLPLALLGAVGLASGSLVLLWPQPSHPPAVALARPRPAEPRP
jgi:hypothetical protein